MGHVADFVLILADVITAGLIIWRDRTSSWQTAAGPEGQRLLFIDNLRIVLICGVLVVHLAVPIRSGKTVGLSSAGGFSRYGGFLHAIGMRGFVSILLDAPEYSIGDCISNLRMRDVKFSCRWLGDEYMGVNLLQEIPELSVPVVFFAGSYDYATPFVLVEEFYDSLQAPYKKLIWFEHSAHNPDIEEPDKFQRALIALGDEFCSEKHPQDALVAKLKKEQS